MKIEWVHKKLGECCDRICNGLTYDVEETQGYLVTRIETISDGYIDYNKIGHINDKPNQDYLMVNGDILFSHINSVKHIGKVAYYDDSTELYHGMNLLLLRANNSIDKLFLFYLLSSDKYRRKIRTLAKSAVNQASISTTDLGKFELSYPNSLPAQRHIASILSSADKVIASTQKVIAKYKQMKQGMMEDLLKPKEGWKMVRLGEVCEPSSEKYNPLTENTFQYCVEMENINQESGTINGKSDITKLLSLKTKFHKGEVLYGKLRPYLRKYWLADFDGACSTEIWVLKNSENIDNQFLFYLFQSDCINRIANQSSGTKMPRADWKYMESQNVSIPYKNDKPDLVEQRRIAAILSGIDAKIAAEEKVLEKYEKVKKGMMERLLNEKNE